MNKKVKLLSGLLMASIISSSFVDFNNFYSAKASNKISTTRNSSASTRNSSETSDEEILEEDVLDEEIIEEEVTDETLEDEMVDEIIEDEESSGTTNLLEMLNSDDSLTMEDISNFAAPISNSPGFIDEFKTEFPDLSPLRKLSPIDGGSKNYLDVNSESIQTLPIFLDKPTSIPSIYSEQNMCFTLLNEIESALKDIELQISEELPSTIFSLQPTIIVFEDTYDILYNEYYSIVNSNSENQITLNMLLKDTEEKLTILLTSINDFKEQLPDLIDTLNDLVLGSSSSSDSQDEELVSDEELLDEELTDEEIVDEELTEEEIIDEEIVDEELVEEEIVDEEVVDEELTDEEIDPTQVILYFGDYGQELVYDEESGSFFQLDPENPDSGDLVEYTGEVSEMTLAEYLDIDVYFDTNGNELLFDGDTNSYFILNTETGEFEVYSGEVIHMKMKDVLEQSNE